VPYNNTVLVFLEFFFLKLCELQVVFDSQDELI
jgi:hypothetical protein